LTADQAGFTLYPVPDATTAYVGAMSARESQGQVEQGYGPRLRKPAEHVPDRAPPYMLSILSDGDIFILVSYMRRG
jgi:hypothetical protein